GREMSAEPDYSEEIAREIDDEIRRVIEEGHEKALTVLRQHMDELHRMSGILIERETIDKDQFERLLAGEDEIDVFVEETPPLAAVWAGSDSYSQDGSLEALLLVLITACASLLVLSFGRTSLALALLATCLVLWGLFLFVPLGLLPKDLGDLGAGGWLGILGGS